MPLQRLIILGHSLRMCAFFSKTSNGGWFIHPFVIMNWFLFHIVPECSYMTVEEKQCWNVYPLVRVADLRQCGS